jgi:hypothetical protein
MGGVGMKRLLPIVIGTLALTACGSKTVYVTNTEAPDTTTKVVKTTDAPIATPAPTLPPVTWSAEDEFLFDIKNSIGYVAVPDYDLLDTGYMVCSTLRSGATAQDLLVAIAGVGYEQEFLVALSASAVLNLCPDQAWKIEAL